MATEQDVREASRRGRDAVDRKDLPGAKAALAELEGLVKTFEAVQGRTTDLEQLERVREWLDLARSEHAEVRSRSSTLELDMLDPLFDQRVRQRAREQAAREEANRAKAAQLLKGLGGSLGALAGLANLGRAVGSPANAPSTDQLTCRSCQAPNPPRARFCMECGEPTTRRCTSCGAEFGQVKFCPDCGTRT